MAILRMNPQQMQGLIERLNWAQTQLQIVIESVDMQLRSTTWTGPDADQFRNDWNNRVRKELQEAIDWLQRAENSARKNLAAQIATSQCGTGRII
jgi:hypothetical protein